MFPDNRAQSEVIGVVLLLGVVVLAVSTYGFFYLSTIDDGSQQPHLTIHGSVNPPNVTLTHAGGETVGEGELLAVVTITGEPPRTVQNDAVFEPGESFSVNASNATLGDTISISVYHPTSGRKLFTDSWAVDEEWVARTE